MTSARLSVEIEQVAVLSSGLGMWLHVLWGFQMLMFSPISKLRASLSLYVRLAVRELEHGPSFCSSNTRGSPKRP
jgi:hypothetical protein